MEPGRKVDRLPFGPRRRRVPQTAMRMEEAPKSSRIWLISASGGEALPLYSEKLDVHAFAWAPDSSAIYFSAKSPLTSRSGRRAERRMERRGQLARAVSRRCAAEACGRRRAGSGRCGAARYGNSQAAKADAEPSSKLPAGAETIAKCELAISEIAPSPDGKQVAFLTEPIHKRIENPADYEIFLVAACGRQHRQVTHNQAVESNIRWSPDGRWIHFVSECRRRIA